MVPCTKCIGELQTIVKSHADNTDNPHKVTKAQVGLGNVDNTSDLNKPVSTATQKALNDKADTIHTHTQSDITDFNKPTVLVNSDKSSIDLNDITTLGTYISYSPMQYDNCPTTLVTDSKGNPNYSFSLIVLGNRTASTNGTPVYYTQIIIDGFSPTQNSVYIREKYGNAGWTEWYSFYTTKNKIKQADITDFNAPVYLELPEGSESVDLNDITEPGVYCSLSSVKYESCPLDITIQQNGSDVQIYSFILIVCKSNTRPSTHAGGYITQIYINTWNKGCETFIRNKWGIWYDWFKYYSSSNKPTLEDIVGSAVLPVSKGGTGFSTISGGYALVGNGTSAQLGTRFIRNNILQNSSDLVTSGAVYTALNTKADKEKISEFEESLNYTDKSIAELKETLNKTCYLVGAKDSDANLLMYCDVKCTGVGDNIAIQELIDTVPSGSEIKFLAGNYNLKDSLKINKSLSLIGSGLNTVFTATYIANSKILTDTSIFWVNSIGSDNVVEKVQISNLKVSKGLCKLDNKYIAGDGTEFSTEYPGYTDSTRGALVASNVIKLKLDSVQFENKLTTGSTSMIRCTGSTTKIWTIYLRDCFHTNNGSFNGYFIDTGAGSFDTNFTTLTLALSGCDSTDSLGINLPTEENKNKVLDNSFNVKYYIKGKEQ